MMTKKIGMFDSFKGQSGVDPAMRASHVDGGVEVDKSLKPVDNDKIGELMRREEDAITKVMDVVMETKADHSALDI